MTSGPRPRADDGSRPAADDGPRSDAERLFPVVYDRLRALARRRLAAERSDHTLQPTALVHEAYLRLADQRAEFASRTQFVAIASRAMRRILIDHARARATAKRGGGVPLVTLETGLAGEEDGGLDVLVLDQALDRLARLDARQARLVELRFFGGLEIEEAADALGVSRSTAVRDWRRARAFLARALEAGGEGAAGGEPGGGGAAGHGAAGGVAPGGDGPSREEPPR